MWWRMIWGREKAADMKVERDNSWGGGGVQQYMN